MIRTRLSLVQHRGVSPWVEAIDVNFRRDGADAANEKTSPEECFELALDCERRGDELAYKLGGGSAQDSPTRSWARGEAGPADTGPATSVADAVELSRHRTTMRVATVASVILDFLINNQDHDAPDVTAFTLAKYLDQREVLCRHSQPSK